MDRAVVLAIASFAFGFVMSIVAFPFVAGEPVDGVKPPLPEWVRVMQWCMLGAYAVAAGSMGWYLLGRLRRRGRGRERFGV